MTPWKNYHMKNKCWHTCPMFVKWVVTLCRLLSREVVEHEVPIIAVSQSIRPALPRETHISFSDCSFQLRRHVDWLVEAYVSEKHNVAIFRAEVIARMHGPVVGFCQPVTRHLNPKKRHKSRHRSENLNSLVSHKLAPVSKNFQNPI